MSQKGSSTGGENPQLKYKKALMQIQKIHNANKVLKNQSEEMRDQYQRQISQLNNALQQHEKQNQSLKHQKADIQKYYEQLQISHSELRKEYNILQKEYAYLNDVLTEQNNQLKKVNAFKDEKGLANLINSYEDKQMNYRKDISRLEEITKSLKNNYEVLENDLAQQKRQRFKLEDLNNNLRMEISKYRELNNTLISKNQNIVATLLNRSSQGKQKYREAQTMLRQLSKQLQLIKSTRIQQQTSNKGTVTLESYEVALHQKGKLQNQILKLRQKLDQYEARTRSNFQIEQKMKRALLHAEQLQQQCNMLKGKLILVEAKDVMDGSTEFSDLKDLEEKILAGISQNDPLVAIKNSSDSSHFQLMKSYIVQLKEKLSKALIEKKEVQKKYRSLKDKLTDKAQKAIGYEQQNKLLKGKLQGYERLTQRLQFQLQRSIQAHDEEISKMKNVTNNIINKKTEEVKVANAYVRAQLDLELDKFQKTEKNLRQEVETLRLQVSTQKIKNADLQQSFAQTNQFLQIYQKKFNQLTSVNTEFEENNQNLQQNALKYQQLYRQQRNKNETLLVQKQTLTSKLAQVSEDYEKMKITQGQIENKYTQIEGEAKKTKVELTQAKNEIQNLQNILKISKKQFQDKSRIAMLDISRTQSSYFTALEHNFNQEKQRNKELQAEVQSLKLRLERALYQSQKVVNLQDALNQKNDEINDFRRKNIISDKNISVKEAQIKQAKNESDILRRQNNALKAKLLQSGQQLRRSYQSKDFQGKKVTQKLNQELSSALSQLREERRIGARMQSDVQSYRTEIQRLETLIDQAKNKELNLYEQVSQLRNSYQNAGQELQRLKSEIKFKNGLIDGLNNEISSLQQKVYKISQQNSEGKIKNQELDNQYSELKRQINGIKIYLKEIEEFGNAKVASENWQEKRDRENISNFAQKLKKILKKVQVTQSSGQYRPANILSATSSPIPDYLRSYNEPVFTGYEPKITSLLNSPYPVSYGGQNQYNYGDYN